MDDRLQESVVIRRGVGSTSSAWFGESFGKVQVSDTSIQHS